MCNTYIFLKNDPNTSTVMPSEVEDLPSHLP